MNSAARRALLSTADRISPFVSDRMKGALINWIASSLKDQVVTYRELATRDDVRLWWFGSQQEYEFTHPRYCSKLPKEIARLIGQHECHRPFVLEVPNAVVTGQQGFKITEDGRYMVFNFWRNSDAGSDSLYVPRFLAYDFVNGLNQGSLPNQFVYDLLRGVTRGIVNVTSDSEDGPAEFDVAISLLSAHATNYTHWTQEALTLLEGLEEYASRTGNDPTIIIPSDPPSFVPESLEVMGYSDDQYIEWNHDQIRVNRLVVPSVRRCLIPQDRLPHGENQHDQYFRMASGFEFVRDRARETVRSDESAYSTKILISREDAETRRMVNREEVAAALSPRGFETHVPGAMAYRDQVRLFSQADIIVGTHGAGMINSIYATDASVIELYGSHYLPANFELAQGLGLEYGCLRCDPVGKDVSVDIDELLDAVDAMEG